MLITDPVGDMLIRIKNALLSGKPVVTMPFSKLKESIAHKLVENGYIEGFEIIKQPSQNDLAITLKYVDGFPAVSGIEQISKPGRRLYSSKENIPESLNGYGITIISTSRGVLTDKEAKQQNVGGELICKIW